MLPTVYDHVVLTLFDVYVRNWIELQVLFRAYINLVFTAVELAFLFRYYDSS
jgi:hypothetical protein